VINLGINRWMRRVLPRSDIVTFAVVSLMSIEVAQLICIALFGNINRDEFMRIRTTFIMLNALGYGIYRIVAFHPAANAEYRAWLKLTPWSAEKPLPAGPLQLVPQDLVVICLLLLFYRPASIKMLYIPTTFLIGYQLSLAIYARLIGQWALAYLIAFGFSFIILFWDRPEAAFVAADGCFIIGRIAVSRALKTFPWDLPWQAELNSFKAINEEQKKRRLGWPVDQLAPKDPERMIPYHDGICISLIAGCWCFGALTQLPTEARLIPPMMVIIGSGGALIAVLAAFAASHRSPLGIIARLLTLRWIIPSYDEIAIVPLVAILLSICTQVTAIILMAPRVNMVGPNPLLGMILSSIGLSLTLLLLLVCGPVLERWRLAAQHKIVFDLATAETVGKADQFVQL